MPRRGWSTMPASFTTPFRVPVLFPTHRSGAGGSPAGIRLRFCCGLIDAHEFAQDPIALEVLKKSTEAAVPHLPEKALSRAEQEARIPPAAEAPHGDLGGDGISQYIGG